MMVLGQCGAVLVVNWWYWVRIIRYCLEFSGTGLIWALMPVYIEKSEDLFGCYHSGTNNQTRKDGATQPLHWTIKG